VGETRTVTATVLVAIGTGERTEGAGDAGRVLARADDRLVLMFDSVGSAVVAARRLADQGAVVGVAVGELTTDDHGGAGPARATAEALARRAQDAGPGHIVATATLEALAPPSDGPGGVRWVARGPLVVDGVDGTHSVDCVEAQPVAPTNDTFAVPLPTVLGLEAEFPFVGRDEAWVPLVDAWSKASSGGRRAVLAGGEAGSGKTRLVTELSCWVHERGGAVMYGACSEQSTVPYEPFAMAVDQLTGSLDATDRARLLRGQADELARIVPRLADEADRRATTDARSSDPDAERFRLFSAITTMLATLSNEQPLLLVLDDLHWAHRPTIELLDHLMRSPGLGRACFVATHRSTPSEVGGDFKAALPDLRRHAGVTRVTLRGFDRDGVRRFVTAAAGHEPAAGLEPMVDVLVRETEGNAFLLGELWRHLVDTGQLVQVGGRWHAARPLGEVSSPESVRDVVAARLDRLPRETRQLLHVAAVFGTSFPIAVIAEAAGHDVRQVMALLDPALRAHIVQEGRPGEQRFIHALVRRAVVDGLAAGERRAHHVDIAHALERLAGDRAAADVAHHMLEAVPVVEPGRAVEAGRRAARAARRAVAYDDAARLIEAVLPLVPRDRQRGELLLELADARMRAGDVAAAQDRCLEATELARELDEPTLVVRAALAFDDANWRAALHGGVAEELLRAALPLATDPAVAVRVQAGLGRALALSGRGEEAEALGEATIAMAREVGDAPALRVAYAAALFTPWTPANLDRQRDIARELIEHARVEDDSEWELGGINKLLFGSITVGDLDEARLLAARHQALSARVGQPLFRVLNLQGHALLALGEGRFAEAESLAEEADIFARFLSGNDAAGGYGVQVFSIRREQGRLDEARPLVEAVARFDQAGSTWRPALAVLYAELGWHDDAARELAFLAADGFAAVPRDSLWWGSLSYLADACVALGDREVAAAVYRELAPARGLVVQVGNLLAAYGAVDRYLGALSALLGRDRDAESHFESALRIDRRAGMPVWLARTQVAYGRFLAGRARPRDLERAAAMLRAGYDTARSCGMTRVAEEAAGLVKQISSAEEVGSAASRVGVTHLVAALTPRELAVLPLLAEGRTNREIGERLHISQHTAANHVRSILLKTGCANRTEAAAWALRQGLAGD
jgi:DNA-binding CsgD family transcriptional regulator/tetratricopeptide (TPR) repeat protein